MLLKCPERRLNDYGAAETGRLKALNGQRFEETVIMSIYGWRAFVAIAVFLPNVALSAFDQTTPRKAYDSLLQVFKAGDAAGYASLLEPVMRQRVEKEIEDKTVAAELGEALKAIYNELKSRTVERIAIDGDKASVILAAQTGEGGDSTAGSDSLDFVRIGGLWYYAPIAAGEGKPSDGKDGAKTDDKDAGQGKDADKKEGDADKKADDADKNAGADAGKDAGTGDAGAGDATKDVAPEPKK
jgi:hypothetical protein